MGTFITRAAIAAALCVTAAAAWAQGITGNYLAEGRNPDGSTYTGTVQITQSGTVVSMAWRVGPMSYVGSGVIDGRVVTVEWGDAHPVIYVTMPNGTLHGTWADGRALERLRRN